MDNFFNRTVLPLPKTISIIGLAKNVGKTTALNYILDIISEKKEIKAAVSSSGWDGEEYDSVTGKPKPRIIPSPGTLIATSEECLKKSSAQWKLVEKTGLKTSMGETVIAEITMKGYVEIAGPSTISGLLYIKNRFKELGCNFIIFDGAINRKASSCSAISDEIIFSTGLNAGYSLDEVKNISEFWLSVFDLPLWQGYKIEEKRGILFYDEEGNSLGYASKDNLSEPIPDKTITVYISGAFTDKPAEHLLLTKKPLNIIIEEPPSFFLSRHMWSRLRKRNNRIFFLRKAPIKCITLNPVSSSGNKLEPRDFFDQMADICKNYDTWDVISRKGKLTENASKIEA